MTTGEGSATSVQLRRMIAAPRDEVFDAFTQPEHLRRWWGPDDFVCPEAEVDLRPGGAYRLVMQPPTGPPPQLVVAGTYEEVERPTRLVYTWHWESGPPSEEPESLVTVDFHDRDGDTEVVVTHGRFPAGHDISNYSSGWESGLGKLAALVSRG